jgi:metallo-beta-lactamase class B
MSQSQGLKTRNIDRPKSNHIKMKTKFLLVGLMLSMAGLSQPDYKTITVSKDIYLVKITDNAYVHVSILDMPNYGRVPENGLIYINENKAFLFDTPWTDSLTKDLISWINDSLKTEFVGCIPNHWHVDCMGGLGYIQTQKIPTWANQMTIDIAKTKNLPVPEKGFTDSLQLHLGDKLINCYYLGAAHSLDNIVVWIPSEKILFAGCMVKSINTKNLGNTADGDLIAYPETIDKLIRKFPDAKVVIPGHGQVGGFDLITHTKELCTKNK